MTTPPADDPTADGPAGGRDASPTGRAIDRVRDRARAGDLPPDESVATAERMARSPG